MRACITVDAPMNPVQSVVHIRGSAGVFTAAALGSAPPPDTLSKDGHAESAGKAASSRRIRVCLPAVRALDLRASRAHPP
jgi:hypothetical protein